MKAIDDKGRLFGAVNVIDAVGIVLIIALIVSAGAVVIATSSTNGGSQNSANGSGNGTGNTTPMMNQTTSIAQFQLIDDAPYVVNGIDKGPVPSNENIVSVLGSSKTTSVPIGTNNTTSNASLRLRINLTTQQGTAQFKDERLYIGSQFRLDLGKVVVDAIVTDFEVENRTTVVAQTPA